jgi:hypothetical protein
MPNDAIELKEFVTTAITDICEGISEAKKKYDIPPTAIPSTIDFDLSVIVEQSTAKKAGGKLSVGLCLKVLGASSSVDGEIANDLSSITTQRIKFSVPTRYLTNDESAKYYKRLIENAKNPILASFMAAKV